MNSNEYITKNLLQIKNQTIALTFLTTFWAGCHIMIVWNTLDKEVVDIWGMDEISDEDIQKICAITKEYMSGIKEIT